MTLARTLALPLFLVCLNAVGADEKKTTVTTQQAADAAKRTGKTGTGNVHASKQMVQLEAEEKRERESAAAAAAAKAKAKSSNK